MKLKDLLEQYGEYDVVLSKREATNEIRIEGRKPKQKTVWDLKEGDDCYYIDLFGDIEDTGGYLRPLSEAIDTGIVFLTKEEAEKDVERRKVETLLLKHGGHRWFKKDKDTPNYYLWNSDTGYCLNLGMSFVKTQGVIYFDSREELTKAVEQIGAERIIKALFEVR